MGKKASIYGVHPAFAYQATIIANMKETTGRALADWIHLLKKSGLESDKERLAWLKSEHGLGRTTATVVVEQANGKGGAESYDPEALVEQLFSGARSGLRPLYDSLLQLAGDLGKDVRACPCQTMVPFYRKHVFAQVKPATRTRIDLGLALKDTKARGRLLETGGMAKGDRITHRIPISSADDVDAEVERWLEAAYDLDT